MLKIFWLLITLPTAQNKVELFVQLIVPKLLITVEPPRVRLVPVMFNVAFDKIPYVPDKVPPDQLKTLLVLRLITPPLSEPPERFNFWINMPAVVSVPPLISSR